LSTYASRNEKGAKHDLKSLLRQLTGVKTLLKSKRSRAIATSVRNEIVQTLTSLQADVKTLRRSIACPLDAE
jgi:hypothetical protein